MFWPSVVGCLPGGGLSFRLLFLCNGTLPVVDLEVVVVLEVVVDLGVVDEFGIEDMVESKLSVDSGETF